MRLLGIAALAAVAAVLAGCGATGHLGEAGYNTGNGKSLFQSKCGACHVLKDANTQGVTGPNLDYAFGCAEAQDFAKSTVRDVVRGQIDYASPPMPRKLVKGADADDVAAYVADVAGTGIDCTSTNASLPVAGR